MQGGEIFKKVFGQQFPGSDEAGPGPATRLKSLTKIGDGRVYNSGGPLRSTPSHKRSDTSKVGAKYNIGASNTQRASLGSNRSPSPVSCPSGGLLRSTLSHKRSDTSKVGAKLEPDSKGSIDYHDSTKGKSTELPQGGSGETHPYKDFSFSGCINTEFHGIQLATCVYNGNDPKYPEDYRAQEVVIKKLGSRPSVSSEVEMAQEVEMARLVEAIRKSKINGGGRYLAKLKCSRLRPATMVYIKYTFGDLFEFASHNRVLSKAFCSRVLTGVCSAIHLLHRNGVAHGDIKLENIFVRSCTGEVVLGDFGASKSLPSWDREGHGNRNHIAPGTLPYIPLEMLVMPAKIQDEHLKAQDIYAVGWVMIYINSFVEDILMADKCYYIIKGCENKSARMVARVVTPNHVEIERIKRHEKDENLDLIPSATIDESYLRDENSWKSRKDVDSWIESTFDRKSGFLSFDVRTRIDDFDEFMRDPKRKKFHSTPPPRSIFG